MLCPHLEPPILSLGPPVRSGPVRAVRAGGLHGHVQA